MGLHDLVNYSTCLDEPNTAEREAADHSEAIELVVRIRRAVDLIAACARCCTGGDRREGGEAMRRAIHAVLDVDQFQWIDVIEVERIHEGRS